MCKFWLVPQLTFRLVAINELPPFSGYHLLRESTLSKQDLADVSLYMMCAYYSTNHFYGYKHKVTVYGYQFGPPIIHASRRGDIGT